MAIKGVAIVVEGVDYSSLDLGRIFIVSNLVKKACADYIAVVGITSDLEKNAINNLGAAIYATGAWDKLTCIYPLMGTTSEQVKYNLKNVSENNLTFTGSGMNINKGVSFAGLSKSIYGNTGYAMDVNDFSFGYYSRENDTESTNGAYAVGVIYPASVNYPLQLTQGTPATPIPAGYAGAKYTEGALSGTTNRLKGLLSISRKQLSYSLFEEGFNKGTKAINDGATPTPAVLCINGITNVSPTAHHSFLFGGKSLTDIEMKGLTDAIISFLTTLGRN